jgi:hypothetical protein
MAIMLGLGKKKPGAEMEADEPDDMGKTDAAQALIDAVQGGDAAAVTDAFQTMYDLCMQPEPVEDEGEYEEESAELEM